MKKIIITLFLCFLFNTNVASAKLDFPDVKESHWAYNNVKILKDLGIVVGYPNGTFKPDEFVTRAEFSSMAVKALKLTDKEFKATQYKDLPPSHWGYRNIQLATTFGLVSGHTDAYFLPNDDVKRIEVISVIMNALSLEDLTNQEAIKFLEDYKDANLTPSWALVKTAHAKKMGMVVIMPGREGYLEPLRPATRGELAVFLCKMMEAFEKQPSEKISKKEQPKTLRLYEGTIVENAYLDGNYAIIPAGTIFPLAVMACTKSEKTATGNDFRARFTKNYITKEKRLLIPVGSQIYGVFQDIKKPRYFVRNSSMVLASDILRHPKVEEGSKFNSVANIKAQYRGKTLWDKIGFYVVRGQSTPLHKSSMEDFILLEPIRIEIKDEWVNL